MIGLLKMQTRANIIKNVFFINFTSSFHSLFVQIAGNDTLH